jgi:hypothetical protein
MPLFLRKWAVSFHAASGRHARGFVTLFAACATAFAFTSCSISDVMTPQVDVGIQTSSLVATQPRGFERLASPAAMTAAYPRFSQPLAEPGLSLSSEEEDCRKQLRRLGVTFQDLAPINDGGACRVDNPVKVSSLPGNVAMKPAATLSCQMALAFATWTRSELTPAARWRYLSGVKTIHQGSSYSCRRINGTGVASEHSKGNALDVMRIELRNGKDIDVRKPGWFAFRERSLLNNVRAGGCEYFTTVLGPGYNADHADHFHFDVKNRRNGRVACR